jgi:hypothetical protein
MKSSDIREHISQAVQSLSSKLIDLARRSWLSLHASTEVAQELAKDPFTSEVKSQAATAEFLILLLHACDRIAAAAFHTALSSQAAPVLRNSFMAALVGVTLPAFARTVSSAEEVEDLKETQADLLHLYNTRVTQYGFFPLGSANTPNGNEPLVTLAGIRLAEALECPENPEVITHGVEAVMRSLAALRQDLPLKETLGQLIAGLQ